eukprot:CAMPEP_0173468480 /NCGR_PEP_ID=MMETSP1357-20121228/76874_1 /TAXON_ID=77926 /ORGANISM="Hemiselmis rufescens, Strain PCC563" /LENGTH=59 /DNA_ID=CAMNT_0014436701 /DNA_START=606 /DNA_END=785 /DNA_ORIENTATION=+
MAPPKKAMTACLKNFKGASGKVDAPTPISPHDPKQPSPPESASSTPPAPISPHGLQPQR